LTASVASFGCFLLQRKLPQKRGKGGCRAAGVSKDVDPTELVDTPLASAASSSAVFLPTPPMAAPKAVKFEQRRLYPQAHHSTAVRCRVGLSPNSPSLGRSFCGTSTKLLRLPATTLYRLPKQARAASSQDKAVIGAALQSGSKEAKMAAAIQIGRSTASKMQRATKSKDKKALRQSEIKMKMQVLKGSKSRLYRRKRTQTDDDEEQASGQVDSSMTSEAVPEWAFSREEEVSPTEEASGRYDALAGVAVSDEARAVAAQELAGNPKASASQILSAATELSRASEWTNTARLLEIGRKRIDKEQLERKLDMKGAIQLDQGHLRLLATAYEKIGRLNVARETLLLLKGILETEKERQDVSRQWMRVSFMYGSKLLAARSCQAALDVFENMLDTCPKSIAGPELWEETYLYVGMTLHELGRDEEAKDKLSFIYKDSLSAIRKRQARFIYDVVTADVTVEKDAEMHKVWNSTVTVPSNTRVRGSIGRIGSRMQSPELRSQATQFQAWASTYWEERMKSPVYYAFLTLWVTWPFAIPVVSIARKFEVLQ